MDLAIIGLPEGTEERSPRSIGLRPDPFRDFDSPEVGASDLIFTENHGTARIGIHDAAMKTTTTWDPIGMTPKVTELGSLAGYDEQRGCCHLRLPAGSRRSMVFRQPDVAQGGFQTLTQDPAFPQPNLIHTREPIRP
jgi:hypothetical protein